MMPPDFSTPPGNVAFAVDFNPYVRGNYNRDFGGKGELVVRANEPRFLFTGGPRRGFTIGKQPVQLALRSDEITNVMTDGTGVEFLTTSGKSGAKKSPFVFTCATEQDAAAVGALLPATKDADYLAKAGFIQRVQQLPDSGGGLRSITNLLLGANLLVFAVMGLIGAGWFEVSSMTPYIKYGANNGAATTDGEWWRLVTSLFMHYGLVHLLLNAWALFQVGHFVEKLFGRRLFTLLYFGSGIMGGFGTLYWNGDKVWSAGASGAVFGIYGALLGYLLREKETVPKGVFQPMIKSTLLFAGYNLFIGAVHPNIDNAAHLGGLVAGGLLGWICALPLDLAARAQARQRRLRAGVMTLGTAITVGVVAAPRFPYRVAEELAWEEVHRSVRERSAALDQQEKTATASYARDRSSPILQQWLTTKAIPFYEDWDRQLQALELTPNFATAKQREDLRRIIALQLASYRRLLDDVTAKSPDALTKYGEAQRGVSTEVQKNKRQK